MFSSGVRGTLSMNGRPGMELISWNK
jgi:hypothetical protein